PAAAAPERARSERPRSRPRNPKPEAAAKPVVAAKPEARPDRPRQERRDDREERDDNNGVRGFGADTPAFLLRGK
ncbi:MAG TPA: RNA helicase, partial [Caulobacteraceae bacterium]